MDLSGVELAIAGDVDNPSTGPTGPTGPTGAAAVYGPQKGAACEDVATLDAGLRHLVAVLAELRPDAVALSEAANAGAEMGLTGVFALADRTDRSPATDPALSGRLLVELGRTIQLVYPASVTLP